MYVWPTDGGSTSGSLSQELFSGFISSSNFITLYYKNNWGSSSFGIFMKRNWAIKSILSDSFATSSSPMEQRFYHLAVVFDGDTLSFYVDGNFIGSQPLSSSNFPTGTTSWTGIGRPAYFSGFNGKIDDVMIFNRALTPSEVQLVYNRESGDAPEPEPTPYCGDGSCNVAETCSSCPNDCGTCPDEPEPIPYCGDGSCNGAETCSSCPNDCGTCPDEPLPIYDNPTPTGHWMPYLEIIAQGSPKSGSSHMDTYFNEQGMYSNSFRLAAQSFSDHPGEVGVATQWAIFRVGYEWIGGGTSSAQIFKGGYDSVSKSQVRGDIDQWGWEEGILSSIAETKVSVDDYYSSTKRRGYCSANSDGVILPDTWNMAPIGGWFTNYLKSDSDTGFEWFNSWVEIDYHPSPSPPTYLDDGWGWDYVPAGTTDFHKDFYVEAKAGTASTVPRWPAESVTEADASVNIRPWITPTSIDDSDYKHYTRYLPVS